jgi:hypothetical protein
MLQFSAIPVDFPREMAVPLLVFAILLAQGGTLAPVPAKAQAQAILKEGTLLFKQGDLEGALNRFSAAYAIYPNPKILFNIAQTAWDLGRHEEAAISFEAFISKAGDAESDFVAEAKQALSELQSSLGRLYITCNPSGAEITVDGKSVGRAPVPHLVWIKAGHHDVTANQPDAIPAVVSVDVPAGAIVPVSLQLTFPEPEIVKKPDTRPAEKKWLDGKTWSLVAAGVTVACAAAAVGFGMAMQSRFDELKQSCGKGSGPNWPGCSQADMQGLDQKKSLANGFWIATAVAAAGTTVLWFVEGKSIAVAPVIGSASGVQVSTRF